MSTTAGKVTRCMLGTRTNFPPVDYAKDAQPCSRQDAHGTCLKVGRAPLFGFHLFLPLHLIEALRLTSRRIV